MVKGWFDFLVFQEMLHIADTKMARRYGDFFIRQIHKLEEVMHTVLYRSESTVFHYAAVYKRLIIKYNSFAITLGNELFS